MTFRRRNNFKHNGFSLLEATVCVLIVSTMIAASLQTIGSAATAQRLTQDKCKGISLARDLLTEITQQWYADPKNTVFGPETNERRANFDDVDDYNNYQEDSATNRSGTILAGATGWRRSVSVAYVSRTDPTTVSATDTSLKRIVVTVTSPTGQFVSLTGLRAKAGAAGKTLESPVTYVSRVTVTVGVGTDTSAASTQSANILNQMP